MIIGVDPGKSGGFALLDGRGGLVRCDPMPLLGGKISAVAIAELYEAYSREIDFNVASVVIEELFTKPNDSLPQAGVDALRAVFEALGQILTAVDGDFLSPDHVEDARTAYKAASPYADAKIRADGRKGLLSYAKGAGMLFMPALWGWPIKEVKPSIWARKMKEGIDRSLSSKERSVLAAASLWPDDVKKGGRFWTSDRAKSPHDGMVEAALMAEWLRRTTG